LGMTAQERASGDRREFVAVGPASAYALRSRQPGFTFAAPHRHLGSRSSGVDDLAGIGGSDRISGSATSPQTSPKRFSKGANRTPEQEEVPIARPPTTGIAALPAAPGSRARPAHETRWRRKGDSNPRSPVSGPTVFETARFDPSGALRFR
jgi:hypothetical protein